MLSLKAATLRLFFPKEGCFLPGFDNKTPQAMERFRPNGILTYFSHLAIVLREASTQGLSRRPKWLR